MDSISIAPTILFYIGVLPVTNAMLMSVVVVVFLIAMARLATRNMQSVPRGVQFWVEAMFSAVYDFLLGVTKSESVTKKIFPLIMTLFLFILFGNMFAYVPGISTITYDGKALYRTITSDYSFVLLLTLITFTVSQVVLVYTGGIMGVVRKFINVSGPWSQKPINLFLGIMDLIGEASKVVSLSFRLFGNMFAGEVLSAVVAGLVPFILPLPFAILGLLTMVVQPTVFSLLSTLYITGNVVSKPEQA